MNDTEISIIDNDIANFLNDNNLTSEYNIYNYLIEITGDVFRQVKSRTTAKIQINDNKYFIKKHCQTSNGEILKNIINFKNPFDSAVQEYHAILALKKLNIKTLDAVVIANRISKNWASVLYNIFYGQYLNSTSFLITKSIEPSIDLDKFCASYINHGKYYQLKRVLIKYIAQTTRKMHLGGLNHRDYYLCHFLLKLETKNDLDRLDLDRLDFEQIINNLYLIDLHRMQIRKSVPERYLIKDLSALLFSVRDLKLSKADRVRFARDYLNINNPIKLKSVLRKENRFWDSVLAKSQRLKEKG